MAMTVHQNKQNIHLLNSVTELASQDFIQHIKSCCFTVPVSAVVTVVVPAVTSLSQRQQAEPES